MVRRATEGEGKHYEVEAVLDRRETPWQHGNESGFTVEYLVKWKDYDNPADNSWVTKVNCKCPDLIKEFEEKRAAEEKKEAKSKKKTRTSAGDVASSTSTAGESSTSSPKKKKAATPAKKPSTPAKKASTPKKTPKPTISKAKNRSGSRRSSRQRK